MVGENGGNFSTQSSKRSLLPKSSTNEDFNKSLKRINALCSCSLLPNFIGFQFTPKSKDGEALKYLPLYFELSESSEISQA